VIVKERKTMIDIENISSKLKEFEKDLEKLINNRSIDVFANTPDFILSEFLVNNLLN
jgi:hypothetical protein